MNLNRDTRIEVLFEYKYISRRTYYTLLRNGVRTLGDIIDYTHGDETRLLSLPRMGRKAVTENLNLLASSTLKYNRQNNIDTKILQGKIPSSESNMFSCTTTIQELYQKGVISVRSYNALRYTDLYTLKDVVLYIQNNVKYGGLKSIRNLGKKSNEEIMNVIKHTQITQEDFFPEKKFSKDINEIYDDIFTNDNRVNLFIRELFPQGVDIIHAFIENTDISLKLYPELSKDENIQLRKRYLVYVNRVLSFLSSVNYNNDPIYDCLDSIRISLVANAEQISFADEIKYFSSPIQERAIDRCYQKLCNHLSVKAKRIQATKIPTYKDCLQYFPDNNLLAFESMLKSHYLSMFVNEITRFICEFRRNVHIFHSSDAMSQEWLYRDEFPFLKGEEIQFVSNYINNNHHYPLFYIIYFFLKGNDKRQIQIFCQHNGLFDGTFYSLEQTAVYFRLTRERVRQILLNNPLKDSALTKHDDWEKYSALLSLPFITEFSPQYITIKEEEKLPFDFAIFAKILPLVASFKAYHILNNTLLVNKEILKWGDFGNKLKAIKKILESKYPCDTSFNINDIIQNVPKTHRDDALHLFNYIISNLYGKTVIDNIFVMKQNKVDAPFDIYNILFKHGKPMHIDDIFKAFKLIYPESKYQTPNSIRHFILSNKHIKSIGNSSTYVLDSWDVYTGSIRDRIKEILEGSSIPMNIDDIVSQVLEVIPTTNKRSISSTMSGMIKAQTLIKFEGNLWGLPSKTYNPVYKHEKEKAHLSFDENIRLFEGFVITYQRFPFSTGSDYETSINRWYRNVIHGNLTINEGQRKVLNDLLFDFRIKSYPETNKEYVFKEKCSEYKSFVESNKRIPTRQENQILYDWMKKATSDYNSYTDNRRYYLDDLLNYISSQELKESSKQQERHTNLFSNNLDEIYKNYINQFQKIRQANVNGNVIKAKPILLLSVIDGINEGRVSNNCITLNEWLEIHYATLMYRYSTSFADLTEINMPFWHLKNDGFWHLQFVGKQEERTSTPTTSWIRENVRFAYFDEPLWVLLENQEWRTKLRNFIIENKLSK